ncbi:uncharacterized protein LOC123504569 [Portunus trituberculatus]|uniref:uncharacterized protein LOC123504569 n=1 Tax=Portunus trituberculatus TaxID=210409 RepID=UPI001E1D08D9|nr:uncharacterized protein LOC123504569 [Portunus trituberculatus]XP_045111109.1 uncharacterized protein LOC123504569 [Portunus trituberculatus]
MSRLCSWKCSSLSLRVGVLVIAAVELVYDIFGFAFTTWRTIKTSYDYDVAGEKGQPEDVVLVTVAVVASTIDLLFSLMLIHGVIKENVKQIMAWWWWTLGLRVLIIMKIIWVFVYGIKNNQPVGLAIVILTFILTISILVLWVVRTYANYLKRKKMLSYLSLNEHQDQDV